MTDSTEHSETNSAPKEGRGFWASLFGDPTTPERKPSLGRFVLFWVTIHWTAWVWFDVVQYDFWSMVVVLFGPGVAFAFRKSPVKLAGELFNRLRG